MDAGERDRPERGAGVAARAAREDRAQRDRIEREAADRVHEREAVRPGVDDGPGRLGDVPLRRRELRVERQPGRRARGGDELRGRLRRLLDVRAREVELDRGDSLVAVESFTAQGEVRRGEAADRDPELRYDLGEARQVVGDERVDPRPLEADRVEHPVVGLRDPRRRVPLARERRDGLRHEGVERAATSGAASASRQPDALRIGDAHGCGAPPPVRTGPSRQRRT